MDENKKTNLKNILIIILTILVLLTLIYTIPRMIVVLEHNKIVKEKIGFEKVEIEGEWKGYSREVEIGSMRFMLPTDELSQNNYYKYSGDKNKNIFEGYGFIVIFNKDPQNLVANEPIDISDIDKWLGAYSSNEYDYKLVQMNKPIFFQPYRQLKEQYRHYFNLFLSYSFHGNKYFSYSNERYAFFWGFG